MNYIINPSWFYWVAVSNTARVGLFAIGCVGLCISIPVIALAISDCWKEEDKTPLRKLRKTLIILFSVMLIVAVFIPSQQTLIQMMLAKFATYENVADAYQAILDGAKYILEGLK